MFSINVGAERKVLSFSRESISLFEDQSFPDPRLERTFIMIKPDGVQRGLIAPILERFERRGYKLIALKLFTPSRALLEEHYGEHKGKPFFEPLVSYMLMGPVVCMIWEGLDIVKTGRNIVHGSDSVESAEREIKLWFKPEEIQNYKRDSDKWIYEKPFA